MNKKRPPKKGSEFEILIEQLYDKLDPDSIKKRNDKIKGQVSGIEREIDLSIRRTIGPHEVLMIVQAKDYKRPVNVSVVGEFQSVIEDVKANKGILVSPKGFSSAALEYAKNKGIEALTGYDLNNPKWSVDLRMPVIMSVFTGGFTATCMFVASQEYADYVAALKRFGLTPQAPPLQEWKVSEDGGKTFRSVQEIFHSLCGLNDFAKHFDGERHEAAYTREELLLQVAPGVLTPLREFKFIFQVKKRQFYKYFEVKEFQGFINAHTNKINRANVKIVSEDFTLSNFAI